MSRKTSVYLDDDLDAAVAASGEGLAVIIRRGLSIEALTLREAGAAGAESVADGLAGELREIREEIRDLREMLRSAMGGVR